MSSHANMWKDDLNDGVSTSIPFGPYVLQCVRADLSEGDPVGAAIQLVDADGNTIAEQEVDGDPTLSDLRMFAVPFAMKWVGELNMALDRLLKAQDE